MVKKETRKISVDRKPKNKKIKKVVLIAVEGNNKTEKLYFKHFDDGKKSYVIKIAQGNYTDPLNLISSLANEIKKMGLDLKSGDKAYCVFDVDINNSKDVVMDRARKVAYKHGIELITSAPCFEIWFLLHFHYTTSYLDNREVVKKLKEFYVKYKKNTDIFPIILEYLANAISNAKKLEAYQLKNAKVIGSVSCNPNTEVYKIIEYLQNWSIAKVNSRLNN